MSHQPVPSPDDCPHCGDSLLGEPLSEAELEGHCFGDSTHFRRELGVCIPGLYDGVLFWQCPTCGGTWQRFDKTSRMYRDATPYMREPAAPPL